MIFTSFRYFISIANISVGMEKLCTSSSTRILGVIPETACLFSSNPSVWKESGEIRGELTPPPILYPTPCQSEKYGFPVSARSSWDTRSELLIAASRLGCIMIVCFFGSKSHFPIWVVFPLPVGHWITVIVFVFTACIISSFIHVAGSQPTVSIIFSLSSNEIVFPYTSTMEPSDCSPGAEKIFDIILLLVKKYVHKLCIHIF